MFPRGERPSLRSGDLSPENFNPRSRVGNDINVSNAFKQGLEFQSTFPRGERQSLFASDRVRVIISIHVPAWGTTMLF